MQLNRTPGNVFVSVDAPQTPADAAISADWKSIAHGMIAEATPPAAPAAKPITQPASVITPEPNPVGESMKALIAEIDELLDPKPRENKEAVGVGCYHYDGYTVKPKPNYDSPLFTWWNHQRHLKSDNRMAYLKNSKAVA